MMLYVHGIDVNGYVRSIYIVMVSIILQEILPNEEEQVELVTMTTPLLGRVPEEDDIISIDPDQTPGTAIIICA